MKARRLGQGRLGTWFIFLGALARLLPAAFCGVRPVIAPKRLSNALQPRSVERRAACFDWPDSSSLVLAEAAPRILIEVIEFLASAVVTTPLSQALGLNPILGYMFAGLALGPSGLSVFANDEAIEKLAFIGILFLLFEAGLELSSERLRKLTKYAFGLGSLQVLVTGGLVAIVAFSGGVAALDSLSSRIDLTAAMSRTDQVVVIAVSLALSAKAFVLQVLGDKKLAPSTLGQAALGVLLLQDIALVPVLVILPIIEDSSGTGLDAVALATYAAKAVGGIAAIALVGGPLLEKVFDITAASKKREVFFGLCLLCVLGVSQLTNALGLSTTLGALAAGVLLAESNYRTQVEADISPFRGLLVGLFFFTLGARADLGLLLQEWQLSLILLFGIIAAKATVVTALAPLFELSLSQSVQLGFLLATGSGEACLIYGLARQYQVIDDATLKLLTTLVVVSSALTPLFAELGEKVASAFETREDDDGDRTTLLDDELTPEMSKRKITLICGMGPLGQQVASLLSNVESTRWIGMDLDPARVKELRERQQPVYYGDGSNFEVLTKAGLLSPPEVIVVTFVEADQARATIERLRGSYPETPILCQTSDADSYAELLEASKEGGAREGDATVVSGVTETALRIASAAFSRVASVPADVQNEWSQYLRRETEQRLAVPSASEVETFFVGPSPGRATSVWDAKRGLSKTSQAMRYLEIVGMLQDRVLSGSALARLASEIQSSGAGAELARRSFRAGDFVFREGDEGNEMFIVEDGSCAAYVDEEPGKIVAEYTAGENFGEYAMILKQPRPVSIAATTDARVVVIDRAAFNRLTQRSDELCMTE